MGEFIKDFIENYFKGIVSLLVLFFILDILVFSQIFSIVSNKNKLSIYFLPVGQGDSELAVLPGGAKVLIDGGPPDSLVLDNLDKILSPRDRYLDLIILTHPQQDHFGGLVEVLRRYKVGAFIWNGETGNNEGLNDLLDTTNIYKIPNIILVAGDEIKYKESQLKVLWPRIVNGGIEDINEDVIVLALESTGIKALFTADAGENTEAEIKNSYVGPIDILKVGHHGSKFSSSNEFLNAFKPKIAVIEVGKNNYGHPTMEALNRLADVGARVFRTDKDGLMKLESSINALRILKIE